MTVKVVSLNVHGHRIDLGAYGEKFIGDNDYLAFGDGEDVTVKWDGTNLDILPVAPDTGAINIGNGTNDIDFKIFLGSTSSFALFDVGNVKLSLTASLEAERFIIDGDTWEDDGDGYYWGNRIRMDDADAFASGAAKKTLALSIHMDRPATDAMTGDSRDYGYYLDYTNRAVNDTNFNVLGFRSQLSNRASGTLNILRGIEQTVRQRGDGSTISDGIEAGLFSCNLDVSGSPPANFAYGLRVHWRFHGVPPSDAAAFCAHNITDGVYASLPSAYGIRNDGTSSCQGFAYGLDCYDATATPIATADIRLCRQMVIYNDKADRVLIGARIGICNDASPADNAPTNGAIFYFDGTDLKAKNSAGQTATLNNSSFT